MRYLHHQARWQEPKRSHRVVILWVANARKMPTAELDSVGQVYRQPTAIIRDRTPLPAAVVLTRNGAIPPLGNRAARSLVTSFEVTCER